jgi:tripartite-type tricarboxylate transporter receptor subunit TctC
MKRIAFGLAVLGTAVATAALPVSAQDNPLPQGTITIVLPFAAGGPIDGVARLVIERLGPKVNRTFVAENRTGAGGDIAAASVAKAAPDGRQWLFATDSVFTINPHMNATRTYDPAALTAVAKIGEVILLLGVNAQKVSARNFSELVALSKQRELSFGSAGLGSPGHLAFEYLRSVSELKGVHVPYRGAALALQDLVGGQIDASFIVSGILVPQVKSGALRALAVSANTRVEELPEVPTASEAGIPNFEARFANILLAPAKLDQAMLAFMEREILSVAREAEFGAKLKGISTLHSVSGGKEANEWIARERERWGQVLAKTKETK